MRRILCALALALLVTAPASAQESDAADAPEEEAQREAPPVLGSAAARPAHETACGDGEDEDGDGLRDCADADCFDEPHCQAGAAEERTNAACSNFVDDDGDGATDCDDADCQVATLSACRGSWTGASGGTTTVPEDEALPELGEGMSVEDLIGRGGDADGERTDEVCSDGIDNDLDGRTDCADFGCRFDPQVTVCQGQPGLRFSVVAGVGASMDWAYDLSNRATGEVITEAPTAGFTLMQLRALGPIPFIENSFFLINVRAERGVRLTFVNFQIPISDRGHYLSLNSGFGGLSPALIISAARQPLLTPAFYMTRAFEQGNGAALEVGGPIDDGGVLRFRLFGAAGSGEFTGNVGGGFFRTDTRNFTWTAGTQLQLNIVGHYDRFDSPFLYTAVPLTFGIAAGAKYDQRAVERFIGWNVFSLLRVWHFGLRAETYQRYVLDYDGIQVAWNVQLSFLIWPRLFFFAADVGGVYQVQEFQSRISDPSFRRQLDQLQWRAALHWYFWRSTGILAVAYSETYNEEDLGNLSSPEVERTLALEARFRY